MVIIPSPTNNFRILSIKRKGSIDDDKEEHWNFKTICWKHVTHCPLKAFLQIELYCDFLLS